MKYFTKLKLSGYKSIKDVSFTLQPGVNIFIGPNGSGKSNLLEFVSVFNDEIEVLKVFKASLEWRDISGDTFRFDLLMDINFEPDVRSEKIMISRKMKIGFFKNGLNISSGKDFIPSDEIVKGKTFKDFLLLMPIEFKIPNTTYIRFPLNTQQTFLESPVTIGIEINSISKYLFIDQPQLFYDELGAALLTLLQSDDNLSISEKLSLFKNSFNNTISVLVDYFKEYSLLIENVRLKNFVSLELRSNELVLDNIQLEFKLKDGWFSWNHLSDGTKRIIEVIYLVASSKEIALIEEPELGIHPHQLDKLCEFLKEQAQEKQILISTHSPEVLDRLASPDLNNINLVSMKKGETQVRKLTPKQKKKAKYYLEEESFLSDYWKYSDLEK